MAPWCEGGAEEGIGMETGAGGLKMDKRKSWRRDAGLMRRLMDT